jgi:hypothetical protein
MVTINAVCLFLNSALMQTLNPNSHRVGHIAPTLFRSQNTKKNIKCKIFFKLS